MPCSRPVSVLTQLEELPNRALSVRWDEADSTWANIDLDLERPSPGTRTSHRTFELRVLERCHPDEWR